jgi:hypothetical protein
MRTTAVELHERTPASPAGHEAVGLYGHPLDNNVVRAVSAETVGKFVLVRPSDRPQRQGQRQRQRLTRSVARTSLPL